jgi:hypothetical protein
MRLQCVFRLKGPSALAIDQITIAGWGSVHTRQSYHRDMIMLCIYILREVSEIIRRVTKVLRVASSSFSHNPRGWTGYLYRVSQYALE